jgi:hypothetical protein
MRGGARGMRTCTARPTHAVHLTARHAQASEGCLQGWWRGRQRSSHEHCPPLSRRSQAPSARGPARRVEQPVQPLQPTPCRQDHVRNVALPDRHLHVQRRQQRLILGDVAHLPCNGPKDRRVAPLGAACLCTATAAAVAAATIAAAITAGRHLQLVLRQLAGHELRTVDKALDTVLQGRAGATVVQQPTGA